MVINEKIVLEVERLLGYAFKNRNLLIQSLQTRKFVDDSYLKDWHGNDTLEFLGDSVLNFVLMRKFALEEGNYKEIREEIQQKKEPFWGKTFLGAEAGRLTQLRSTYSSNDYLSGRFETLGFGNLYSPRTARKLLNTKCEADILEALIGAVAIDSDWDLSSLVKVVEVLLFEESARIEKNVEEDPSSKEVYPVLTVLYKRIPNGKSYRYECSIHLPNIPKPIISVESTKKKALENVQGLLVKFENINRLEGPFYSPFPEEIKEDNAIKTAEDLVQRKVFNMPVWSIREFKSPTGRTTGFLIRLQIQMDGNFYVRARRFKDKQQGKRFLLMDFLSEQKEVIFQNFIKLLKYPEGMK